MFSIVCFIFCFVTCNRNSKLALNEWRKLKVFNRKCPRRMCTFVKRQAGNLSGFYQDCAVSVGQLRQPCANVLSPIRDICCVEHFVSLVDVGHSWLLRCKVDESVIILCLQDSQACLRSIHPSLKLGTLLVHRTNRVRNARHNSRDNLPSQTALIMDKLRENTDR